MLQLEQIRRNLRQILKLTLPITTSFVAMGIRKRPGTILNLPTAADRKWLSARTRAFASLITLMAARS